MRMRRTYVSREICRLTCLLIGAASRRRRPYASRISHARDRGPPMQHGSHRSASTSPSPSPASSSTSAFELGASANKSTAGSSSSSSASPENDGIMLVSFVAGSVTVRASVHVHTTHRIGSTRQLPSAAAAAFPEPNSAPWHFPITPFRTRSIRPPSPASLPRVFAIWRVFWRFSK